MADRCAEREEPLMSYAKGHSNDLGSVFPEMPAFAYNNKWAAECPDKEAYVVRFSDTERDSITWSELKKASENLAVWFKKQFNLKRGDKVGILSLNRLSYILCDFALQRIGAISVRLYATMDSKTELTRSLNTTECRLLLCQFGSLPSIRDILPMLDTHEPCRDRLVSEELARLEQVIIMTGEQVPGCIALPSYQRLEPTQEQLDELRKENEQYTLRDECTIYSTSGSTGDPKFLIHSFGAALSWASQICLRVGFTTEDRFFCDRPLAHIGGSPVCCICIGVTMIIANPWKTLSDDPSSYLLRVFKEERVTCGLYLPYLLFDIVKNGRKFDEFRRLNVKWLFFGGQTVNYEIIKKVYQSLGIPLFNMYGTTEMGEISSTYISDSLQTTAKYVGLVFPGVEVKIVDQNTREILPRGLVGGLAIKKKHWWYYFKNEEKMAASHDSEGYFYPGDMGKMEENGYIEVLGREDDQMSVGTVKVYPGPIEMMICKHEAVDKAVVFGVPDDRLGQVIGAVVLPVKGGEVASNDIIKFFHDSVSKEDLMTGQIMAPQFVWIEEEFPLTSSGKVDRNTLKRKCLESLQKD